MQENPEDNQLTSDIEEIEPLLYERSPTPLCRICLDSEGELLTACDCAGTQGLVHRKCVREWVTKYSNDPSRCELCKAPWKIEMYSPFEKCMQQWNWCMGMGAWYCTIIITFFIFHWGSQKPLEFGAFLMYCTYMAILHAAWPWLSINVYRLFRTTITLGLCLGMITLISGQQDYRDRINLIMRDRWATSYEKKQALDELKKEYEIDNPWQWEAEGKGGNRQDWLIVWVDIILWCAFFLYVKINNITVNETTRNVLRISSSESDESWTSEESSDTV